MSAKTSVETESNEELSSNRNSDIVNTTIFEALESSEEQNKERVLADMKAKASDILAKVQESPRMSELLESGTGISDEVVAEIVHEMEVHTQTEGEGNKETEIVQEKEIHSQTEGEESKETEIVQEMEDHTQTEGEENKETEIVQEMEDHTQTEGEENKETEIVQEMEDHTQTEGDANKESTEQHVKELDENEMDNKDSVVINKENKDVQPTKPDVQVESEEESKAKETILKEVNVRKEGSRPMLDISRRSKSLGKNFGKKESAMKPPMPNRLSLERIEQSIDNSEGKNTYVLELRKLAEMEKPYKIESVHEDKTNDLQNSGEKMTPVDDSKFQSKVSTPSSLVKNLDVEKTPTGTKLKDKPTEQDNTSHQPDWIKLATKKSERLSQLLDSKDIQVIHALYVCH